ncbi:MAG: FtsQ-type POTRA domain-containing protein [Rickettsiales bacterium]|nr:FtsQ-type POTRA domain-containing protein [Rickettsiales bacterium]
MDSNARWRLLFSRALAFAAAAAAVLCGLSVRRSVSFGEAFIMEYDGVEVFPPPVFDISLLEEGIARAVSGTALAQGMDRADLDRIAKAAGSVEWVKSAAVVRRVPNRIVIVVEPKRIIGAYEEKGRFFALDSDGGIVDRPLSRGFPPQFSGEGAPAAAPGLLSALARCDAAVSKLSKAVFVDRRRWDVYLFEERPLLLRLPAEDAAAAVDKLCALDRESGLLMRDIEAVDARAPDKILIKAGS